MTPIDCILRLALAVGAGGSLPRAVDVVRLAGSTHGLDPSLVFAVMAVESGFDPQAVSEAGAVGWLQVTPPAASDGARWCTGEPPRGPLGADPWVDLRLGECYLAGLLAFYDGDETLALAAYNGGYRQAERLRAGRPLATETANYVVRVQWLRRVCQVVP